MIEMSTNSHKFFCPVQISEFEYEYRFKSQQEYEMEQGIYVPPLNFMQDIKTLDDLENFNGPKNDKLQTKKCFLDFVKGTLHIDPRKRWTPNMSKQHPFISRNNYEGPFVPERGNSPRMSSQSSIRDPDDNSDSSSVSRINKSDEMYEKLGSCPSQILRDPTDFTFSKGFKKELSEEKKQEIFNSRSYRPPILSLDDEYFKGFNLNSLDAISQEFKDKIYNQDPDKVKKKSPGTSVFTATFSQQNTGHMQPPPQPVSQGFPPFQNSMVYNQNDSGFNRYQPQMQPNTNLGASYGYSDQNMHYGGYPSNQQMYMQQPMMNTGSSQQMAPQNQNYMYGSLQNTQMPQNQTQDPWQMGDGFGDPSQHLFSQPFDTFSATMNNGPNFGEIEGDMHPSFYRNQNPQTKKTKKKDPQKEMRVGSWDPKFLSKGKIKKFQHNNGNNYAQGQISNWQNMKKSGGFSKVKRNKNKNKGISNSQNIFTATFGAPQVEEKPEEMPQVQNNQMPFLNIQDPPITAKFDNFKQNLPKSKKSTDNFGKINSSAFGKGQSFAGTYNIDGPLKSSRLPSKDNSALNLNKNRLK